MKMPTCISKFVGHKIRKIRWRPTPSSLELSNRFVTGSWDERDNVLSLWSYNVDKEERDTKLLHEIYHPGDITQLKFLDTETLIAGNSVGSVTLLRVQDQSFEPIHEWKQIHKYNTSEIRNTCSCTGLDAFKNEVITVNEDGGILLLDIENCNKVNTLGKDVCSINAVLYLNQNELITANMRGQLKVWDLRTPAITPTRKFIAVGDGIGAQCVNQHPHQHQILASGSDDGSLCIWDTRQEKYPANLLEAHDTSMLEVQFHPINPNHLFTCSENGSVWHWDSSLSDQSTVAVTKEGNEEIASEANPWLASSATKDRLEVSSVLPINFLAINSVDIENNTLLCGSDNEVFYLVPNAVQL